ncbi:hypothetical protein GN244_ATG12842 [Phytophthora infestans]|uniref:Uncharacterized protein n=1 Tax=Phytophthora infestans TaxID=4787 RepID=A0A833W9Z2_PHYIN|nr:hypothetical protein GN244_ATG12842 [Phytophthora infestans]KAF4134761.1 hypothetical protein GN958_ATG16017 [Phytophthora infestans]
MEMISDEAFLRDVDGFLTSCESPLCSLTDTNESSANIELKISPSSPQKIPGVMSKRELERAKDRERRKMYRARRRLERQILERQVKELSGQVWRLQHARQANCSLSAVTWKAIVEEQLEALQVAQLKQKCLKDAVESGSRLIQELHQQVDSEEYLSNQTDQVFQTHTLDSVSFNTLLKTGPFEYADKRDLPFDFTLASEVLWQLAHVLLRKEDCVLYERLEDVSNTIALKHHLTRWLLCGRSVSVVQSMVGRRYCEENRMVLVWRSFTEGEGAFNGLHSDETGWCIVQPSKTGKGTVIAINIRHKTMHVNYNELDKETFS